MTTPKITGIHPACSLLPEMPEDQLNELVEDIYKHGLRQPIIVDEEGLILDGRHRYKAILTDRIGGGGEDFRDPDIGYYKVFKSPEGATASEEDKIALILSENIHRRHLTTDQRAAIAAELVEKLTEAAKERQLAGTLASDEAKGRSAEKAAKMVGGVSKATVERAVKRKKADPEAHEAAKKGVKKPKPAPMFPPLTGSAEYAEWLKEQLQACSPAELGLVSLRYKGRTVESDIAAAMEGTPLPEARQRKLAQTVRAVREGTTQPAPKVELPEAAKAYMAGLKGEQPAKAGPPKRRPSPRSGAVRSVARASTACGC